MNSIVSGPRGYGIRDVTEWMRSDRSIGELTRSDRRRSRFDRVERTFI